MYQVRRQADSRATAGRALRTLGSRCGFFSQYSTTFLMRRFTDASSSPVAGGDFEPNSAGMSRLYRLTGLRELAAMPRQLQPQSMAGGSVRDRNPGGAKRQGRGRRTGGEGRLVNGSSHS